MAYRKRGNSFIVDVTLNGKRRYKTVKTEAEARLAEVQLQVDMEQGQELQQGDAGGDTPPPVSVSGSTWPLQKAYEETLRVHWLGTKSESFWKRHAGYLIDHFGPKMPLGKITTAQVDDLREALQKRGLAQSSINHQLVTLSMIFKIAHQRGGVAMKPVMGIKGSSRERLRWVTDKEEELIIKLLTQWGRQDMLDWYYLLVDGGLRPDESRRLTGMEIDFRAGTYLNQFGKTKNARRTIPMTTRVRGMLERRVLEHPKGPVFPYGWHVFTHTWERLRAALRLEQDRDFVAYCLRHTFATRLVQRGVAIEVISRLLGHANINQTMVYAKLGAHQYVAAIAMLEPQAHL